MRHLILILFELMLPLAAQNRVPFNGQDLFLNGLNLAWDDFANDIGPNASTPDMGHFESVLDQMEASGANCMRLWLHTNGAHTPAWNGNTVIGPGTNTIADLEAILDAAWERKISVMLCLWSFDMQRTSFGSTITDRANAILSDPTHRESYINNSLTPMVVALAGHPAILAWEIFNEPEGMSNEFGWEFTRHVPMSDIQAFINQCAGAIHRTDPTALVTNGSWSFYATSDVGDGNSNYYRDDRLIAAGGDPDGTLDFYCVHYYDWAGIERSPFHHDASHWGLTKPLVVAEFYPGPPDCVNCGSQPYETLYQRGYAGALAWSWTDSSPSAMLSHIAAMAVDHPAAVLVSDSNPPTITRWQAEHAAFTGDITIRDTAAADQGRALRMNGSGNITWTINNVPAGGNYELTIAYYLPYGYKEQSLVINGGPPANIAFNTPIGIWQETTTSITLQAGTNTIEIQKSWGWMDFDYIEIRLPSALSPGILVEGEVTPGNYTSIVDSAAASSATGTIFADTMEGESIQHRFRVTNTGTALLTLGSPTSSTSEFTVDDLISSLSPGESDIFTVTFSPRSVATHSALITLPNNDTTVFSYYVRGTGTEPPPFEGSLVFGSSTATMSFFARSGKSYWIETSTDLDHWNIAPGTSVLIGDGTLQDIVVPSAMDVPARFFRLAQQ